VKPGLSVIVLVAWKTTFAPLVMETVVLFPAAVILVPEYVAGEDSVRLVLGGTGSCIV
jgi:hypothetical protein